jgi:hypothetical protein
MARTERAERTGPEIFEGQRHQLRIAGGKPDCGRYLRQSQAAHRHAANRPMSAAFGVPTFRCCLSDRAYPDNIRAGPAPSRARLDANHIRLGGRRAMFDFQDLFQWDRFITPTIIKTFYLLVIALIVLFGISGIFSGLAMMAVSPFGGFIVVLSSIASVIVGVIFARIAAEFILIVFRINEHLGVIRDQGPRH